MTFFIAVLAGLPYLNTLSAGFTFDDLLVIRWNRLIRGAHASVQALCTSAHPPAGLYRPLTMLTYLANAQTNDSAWAYHAANLVLHILVAVCVFRLAFLLIPDGTSATITAALFAVHPIHTEAVSSVVGRAELLAALFVLVSLLAFIHAERSEGWNRWALISMFAFALAVNSKESAIACVLLFPVVSYWQRGTDTIGAAGGPSGASHRGACPRFSRVMLPYVVIALGYIALRRTIVGAFTLPPGAEPTLLDNPLAHVPFLSRAATAIVVLWQYVSALAFPLHLSADYSFNQIAVVTTSGDPEFLLSMAGFAVLAILLALNVRRAPGLLLAAAFLVIPMALTANVLFPIGTIKAERLLYLPSFGWCLACGVLVRHLSARPRKIALVVMTVIIGLFSARTWLRNFDWHDNFTLFTASVQTSPRSAKVYSNLGQRYLRRGRLDEAMLHYKQALAILPSFDKPAYGIGLVYERQSNPVLAALWYERALTSNWGFASAHYRLGAARMELRDLIGAEAAFRTGLQIEPHDPKLLIALAMARLSQGFYAEAHFLTEEARPLVQDQQEVQERFGSALLALDEWGHS